MAANSARGEAAAMFGCVIPGAAALAVGVGVYSWVSDHMDEALFAAGVLGVFALAVLVILLVRWLIRGTIDHWHDVVLKKEDQRKAQAHADRLHLENRIMAQRAHLVEVTPDRQFVPMHELDSRAAYVLTGQRIDSLRQTMPQTLHLTMNDKRPALTAEDAPALEDKQAPPVPTFAEVMHRGMLRPGQLLFGINQEGEPLYNDWRSAYHMAISGKTRSGKTRSVAMLATQMVWQMGARLAILDPHGDAAGSLGDLLSPLRPWMVADPAIEEAQMLDILRLVDATGQDRLRRKSRNEQPLLLLVDEMTALLNRRAVGPQLAPLIEGGAQELAKVGIFFLCSGQIWSASRTGGNSALRSSFASALVHRTNPDQARMLIPPDLAREVVRFGPGMAVFSDAAGDFHQLRVPFIERADIELVAQTLTRGEAPVYALPEVGVGPSSVQSSVRPSVQDASESPANVPTDVPTVDRDSGPITLLADSARIALIRQLARSGKNRAEIVREVWKMPGATFNDRGFKKALAEYDEIIRALL